MLLFLQAYEQKILKTIKAILNFQTINSQNYLLIVFHKDFLLRKVDEIESTIITLRSLNTVFKLFYIG